MLEIGSYVNKRTSSKVLEPYRIGWNNRVYYRHSQNTRVLYRSCQNSLEHSGDPAYSITYGGFLCKQKNFLEFDGTLQNWLEQQNIFQAFLEQQSIFQALEYCIGLPRIRQNIPVIQRVLSHMAGEDPLQESSIYSWKVINVNK